ncbi:MAG TPA: type II CAAX endopeptidase family protein [Turneriella sp.]|nr:type II CAAX endopeptidase family protein [Turneriella sp.]
MSFETTTPRSLWQRYVAVVLYLLASFLLTQAISLIALPFLSHADPLEGNRGLPFSFLLNAVVIQMAGFLIPAPLLIKFTRASYFNFHRTSIKEIFLCIGLVFVSMIFFSVLYSILSIEPQQMGFLDGDDILKNKAAFVFVTSLAVPFYEEWIFRGLIFGVLVTGVTERKKIIVGALFCATLFTLSHIEGKHSLSALPPIFTMALIFQYMTWRTQSLWPSIAAHAFQNLLSSAAFFTKFVADTMK